MILKVAQVGAFGCFADVHLFVRVVFAVWILFSLLALAEVQPLLLNKLDLLGALLHFELVLGLVVAVSSQAMQGAFGDIVRQLLAEGAHLVFSLVSSQMGRR